MVEVARAKPPRVEVVKTRILNWHQLPFTIAGDNDLEVLEARFNERVGTRVGEDLLLLELGGALGIEATHRLEERLTTWDRLSETAQQVRSLREAIRAVSERLNALPRIERDQLEALRAAEQDGSRAEARLKAMATGLELEFAAHPVTLGDQELQPGQATVITEEILLAIGDQARLRLRPGGGTSLAEAREQERAARQQLNERLETVGLESVQEAVQAFNLAEELKAGLQPLQARLTALDGDTMDRRLTEAEEALQAARAEVERRSAAAAHSPPPADLDQARGWATESLAELEAAEGRQDGFQAELKAGQTRLAEFRQQREERDKSLQTLRAEGIELQTRYKGKLEAFGDAASRTAKLASAEAGLTKANAALKQTQDTLAAELPEQLLADQERLERAEVLHKDTREQVATAFRLTLAEILAEEHHGALPVVLDDAFTNSDPDRVNNLLQMLDRAAGRGLQLIVLTCHPGAYAQLGAHAFHLDRPSFPRAPARETSDDARP